MNWSRHKLEKHFKGIKKYISYLIKKYPNLSCIYTRFPIYLDFEAKFPGLFTNKELGYWYRHGVKDFAEDIFFCKTCGKSVPYDGSRYHLYCCRACADKSELKQQNYHNTCLEKYGTYSFSQSNQYKVKAKQTCLDKYGVDNYAKTKQHKRFMQCNKQKFVEKSKQTCREHYGTDFYTQTQQYKIQQTATKDTWLAKRRSTCLQKFGTDSFSKTDQKRKLMRDNAEQIREKAKATCLDKYGVDSYSKTKDFIHKIYDKLDQTNEKINASKRANNSFNTSQPEEDMYKLLCKSFGRRSVLRQYHSELYPFDCDFYLPKFDLYIEYNGSWTHGGKAYNRRRKSHKELLKDWEKRSVKAPYYKEAIRTWTIRDPKKRKTAKQNGLRHIEFWNLDQVEDWLDRYGKAKRFSKGMLSIKE
jgi:hypothetical protein